MTTTTLVTKTITNTRSAITALKAADPTAKVINAPYMSSRHPSGIACRDDYGYPTRRCFTRIETNLSIESIESTCFDAAGKWLLVS